MNTFNIPSIDHLVEGVHYTVLDWNFAEDAEANILRQQRTNMPSSGGPSTFKEQKNKVAKDVKSGKKISWAMKGGKPIMVEYENDDPKPENQQANPVKLPKPQQTMGGQPLKSTNPK
jgi:hypothetical protein